MWKEDISNGGSPKPEYTVAIKDSRLIKPSTMRNLRGESTESRKHLGKLEREK